jgi:hypothetical protein
MRLSGQLSSKAEIRFYCDDPALEVSILRDAEGIRLSVTLQGSQKAAYNFRP